MSAADLPSPPPLELLRAQLPLALFLDFDGTLVELAATPDSIVVPSGMASRLADLSRKLGGRLALVSGRSVDDLNRHCGPLAVECAGSHGAELRRADGSLQGSAPAPLPGAVLDEVERFAREHAVAYEAKPHGAALHSRETPEMEERCALFLADLGAKHGLAVKRGKRVAELVWPDANKGAAVRALMADAPFRDAQPIFVGDDATDDDGFEAAARLGGFGIAVGARPTNAARYRLADPEAVRLWLAL